jgi:SP family arabinose:H+ symporter-like MFS transporter
MSFIKNSPNINTENLDELNSNLIKSKENFFSLKNSSYNQSYSSLKISHIPNSEKKKNNKEIFNEDELNHENNSENYNISTNESKIPSKNKYRKLIIYLITLNASFSYLFMGITMGVTDTLHQTFIKLYNWNDKDARFYISLLNSIIPIGGFIGAIFISPILLKRGRRLSLLIANFIGILGICVMNVVIIEVMIIGRFLCGVVLGMYLSCTGIYVKEYVPYDIIGICGSIYELNYSIGIFIAYILGLYLPKIKNFGSWERNNWWRFMLSSPLIFLVSSTILFLFYFKHETPFFSFVFKKNINKARKTLNEIYYEKKDINNILKDYNEYLKNQNSDISFSDIFSKKYRYRFIIILFLQITQQACGSDVFIMYSEDLFYLSGNNENRAKLLTILMGIFLILSGIFTILFIEKLGRKLLLIIGQSIMLICLILLSYFYFIETYKPTIFLIMLFTFVNGFTLTPVSSIYTADVLPEIGIGICVAFNNLFSYLVTENYFGVKVSFFGLKGMMLIFASFLLMNLFITIFWLKETKDLSSDKIDEMYSPYKIEPLINNENNKNSNDINNNVIDNLENSS